MNQSYTFSLPDGTLLPATYCGPAGLLGLNTPAGAVAVEGLHDHRCRRVDLSTGQVIPWQPPQPAPTEFETWAWDTAAERWVGAPTAAAVARDARATRNRLLAATDWRALRAVDEGQPMPEPWRTYRQALRDIATQPGFPHQVTWPQAPQD